MALSPQARWRQITNRLLAVYLVATAVLVPWAGSVRVGTLLATLHAVVALWLWRLESFGARRPAAAVLRDWYPVLLFPLLFKEVELLAAAVGNWGLTATVYELESSLFGGQPAVYLAERWPFPLLSEYLHLCYFAYLVLLPAVGGYWYFSGRRRAFHEMLCVVTLIYTTSFFFFILFPVDSPFYRLPPPGGRLSEGWMFQLVHFFADRGGARGGAFPSTHVAISTGIWLVALSRDRRVAAILVLLVPGLYVATVYGRFHYALDVVAGWGVALGAWAVLGVLARSRLFSCSQGQLPID